MNSIHLSSAAALASFFAGLAPRAQAPEPAAPPAEAESALPPAAGSREARALVEQAMAKMRAYGRGTFRTREVHDQAMLRQAGIPVVGQEIVIDGGFHRDLVWADWDGRRWMRGNGRLVASVDGQWRLRGDVLDDGVPLPFTVDPELLFTVIEDLPASAREVVHVDGGEIDGRPTAILSLQLDGDDAAELAAAGVLPPIDAGGGAFMMLAGPRGVRVRSPKTRYETFLALHVEVASGDLLRFDAAIFANGGAKNVFRFALPAPPGRGKPQAGAAAVAASDDDDDGEGDGDGGQQDGDAMRWQDGLPVREPTQRESTVSFRCDFDQLGRAARPALDERLQRLLRTR